MSIQKILLVILSVISITACGSKQFDAFLRTVDPIGVTDVMQHNREQEERAAREAEEEERHAAAIEEGRLYSIKFHQDRDRWIGKSSDDLMLAWNSSFYRSVQRRDGGEMLTFRHETLSPTWDSVRNETTYYYCFTTFVTDAKGTITSWTKDGSTCPRSTQSRRRQR